MMYLIRIRVLTLLDRIRNVNISNDLEITSTLNFVEQNDTFNAWKEQDKQGKY